MEIGWLNDAENAGGESAKGEKEFRLQSGRNSLFLSFPVQNARERA
ncbi:MAG: hypothetical protein E7L01_00635 [Paenibacillus macerans]|uniref:Uncharacterized protein n=1 Tax=Paenibacillus macerans TaxID=44252 RepID=A0A6N8EQY9_PAEMA|nr:hypothetical protein [Paenibacillus macerans]MBS5909559.1 hypothetical protein [Paenibacillus macerans]MCY7557225.1 hypothetical protein [Paenibacillus macerans]MDU5946864.1 hypothetical protein [Paenibacillus macerans]MDU7471853.1 hypothetical protein [Paenibacillus macerans]MEC0136430.1 hypothetical protein [Paenibacillus macerans]